MVVGGCLAGADQGSRTDTDFADAAIVAQLRGIVALPGPSVNRKAASGPPETSMVESAPSAPCKATETISHEKRTNHAASLSEMGALPERIA
jgi:hypothetical protein